MALAYNMGQVPKPALFIRVGLEPTPTSAYIRVGLEPTPTYGVNLY